MKEILSFIKKIDLKQLVYLYIGVIIAFFVGILDLLGIGSILIFISQIQKAKIPNNEYIDLFCSIFSITEFNNYIVVFGIGLIFIFIFKLVIVLGYQFFQAKYVENFRHILMSKIFRHYLFLDYQEFMNRNSSHFSKTLFTEAKLIPDALVLIIELISEVLLLLFMFIILVYYDWKLFLFLFTTFLLLFLITKFSIQKKVIEMAKDRTIASEGYFKVFSEVFRNFKFIKLINAEDIKFKEFDIHSNTFLKVNTLIKLLIVFPRYLIESIGLIIIVIIILYFFFYFQDDNILDKLSLYALAFYRGLPSLNKINNAISQVTYYKNVSLQIFDDFNLKNEEFELNGVSFDKKIELKNISFQYLNTDHKIFDNFNLLINKGDKVGICGSSGKGKSTLVDIIMGVVTNIDGDIIVDNKKLIEKDLIGWRNKFGYIPQDIYLFDASVADNVTFGREYDEDKLIDALKKANIYEYFETKDGLETNVGEAGVQLSGGQKQRVAIARALYANPEILVLDEATSALDYATEEQIMNEIYDLSKDKTLIIIAHRVSTIEKCNRTINL